MNGTYQLCSIVERLFNVKVEDAQRREDRYFGFYIDYEVIDGDLWFTFFSPEQALNVCIPLPYVEKGVDFIRQNEVKRSLCKYFVKEKDLVLDYLSVMYYVMCDDPTGMVPNQFVKKASFVQQIISGLNNGYGSVVVNNLQRAINEVSNRMPVHETYMKSHIMNNRLIVVDPEWLGLKTPADKLEYHVDKNEKYYERGWTSIGLSDGCLSNKNFILTKDLRQFAPFGTCFHNPQRNLYSTLGMVGDEEPLIRTQSMQDLMNQGIGRSGFNFFTLFTDIPDVWEDQVIIDNSHKNKTTKVMKRYQCFGVLKVKEGDNLIKNQKIAVALDEQPVLFKEIADKAKVVSVKETIVNVGGEEMVAYNVIVEMIRKLVDGVKLTNTAANKGIVRFKDIGYAIDPRTGEERKIDIVVSAKSVTKRRNFSQILEALLNNINGETQAVIPDDAKPTTEDIAGALEAAGLPRDGTWAYNIYDGKGGGHEGVGVCGSVFWGITHDVESMIWDKGDTTRRNNKEVRTAGLKFSPIEFRSLSTRFGINNAIIDEVLSYSQGSENLHEQFSILRSKMGALPDKLVVDVRDIKTVNQNGGVMMTADSIEGTIVDENYLSDGFNLKLPIEYQVVINEEDEEVIHEGVVSDVQDGDGLRVATFDKIYVPAAGLRKCWRHASGRFGLSSIGGLVNAISIISQRHLLDPENPNHIMSLYSTVRRYFAEIARSLSTKKGDISTLGMSVRYPFAAKAVATLSNSLPENTVEIHQEMADELLVLNGDVVLVERFPCLGFMSIRPQKVQITNDPVCRFTIRASGASLKSTNLDFDGDTLFIASFHTPAAMKLLAEEWENPTKICYDAIKSFETWKGIPGYADLSIEDYNITPFAPLTNEEHADIVRSVTSAKGSVGPIVALAYNIQRLVERYNIIDQETNVKVEMFLERLCQSIFEQKHVGQKVLHEVVCEALYRGNAGKLIELGYDKDASIIICGVIYQASRDIGFKCSLDWYFENCPAPIVNRVIRDLNKIYLASRSNLEGCKLLYQLKEPAVDIPSRILKWALSGKAEKIRTPLVELEDEKALAELSEDSSKAACEMMFEQIENILTMKGGTNGNNIYVEVQKHNLFDRPRACSSFLNTQER